MMDEIRIDFSNPTPEEAQKAKELEQNLFRLNHTLPCTEQYDELLHKVFPNMGKDCAIRTPIIAVRTDMVHIGNRVQIMSGILMMAAGGIILEDEVMIAANTRILTNNHDLDNRWIITCKPVKICKKAWIGAGATILPGITIGENAVVGAGSVVTKDVPANTIVAGNPARIIRKIEK